MATQNHDVLNEITGREAAGRGRGCDFSGVEAQAHDCPLALGVLERPQLEQLGARHAPVGSVLFCGLVVDDLVAVGVVP